MRKAESNILSDRAIMELYKVNREAGNEAAIEKYSKYIYKIIHSFKNSYVFLSEISDLYQSGCVGVFEALKNYDANKGKLYSYCFNYVKNEIGEQIRLLTGESSWYFAKLHRTVIKARDEIQMENGTASIDEIMKRTGISRKLVTRELGVDYTKASYERLGDKYYT